MSEKDIFDEKLANKFRDTFENYEAEYTPAHWEQISSALPKSPQMSVWHHPFKKSWVGIAASLTTMVMLAYFYLSNKQEEQHLISIAQHEHTNKAYQNNLPTPIDSIAKQDEQVTEALPHGTLSTQKQVTSSIANSNNTIPQIDTSEKNHSLAQQNSQTTHSTAYETTIHNNQTEINQEQTDIKVSNKTTNPENNQADQTLADSKFSLTFLPIYQDSIDLQFEVALPKPTLALVSLEEEKYEQKPKRNIAWGLAANPTIFRNELDNQFTVESGLQVSIPIASRLRLVTGILVANQQMDYSKSKTLAREFVSNPKDLDISNVIGISSAPQPNWVEVKTTMRNAFTILNIPIQIQYDFMYGEKTRFFASIGTTNFTYLSEQYDYNNQIEPLYVSTSNRFGHSGSTTNYNVNYSRSYSAFSSVDIVNSLYLSTGVEFQMSNHFSLQAAPFVRVPIRRVGHQALAFDTFGIAVLMNYK